MKTSEAIKRLSEIFYEKLETKTGWGKLEVKGIFQESREQLLMEMLDDRIEK